MDIIHGLSILNCFITFGDVDTSNRLNILNPTYINEVVNIEIKDSYKNLINTAKVQFTRQITAKTAQKNDFGEREIKLVGENGIFKRGQRIKIQLWYSEIEGDETNKKTMFDGYITSIIADNPFTLECEDMGYILKQTALSAIKTDAKGTKLNDFCEKILLKDTGLSLHPATKEMNMEIGQIVYPQSCTAADILNRFKKWGIMAYIRNYNGIPHLALGRTMFSVNTSESLLKDMPATPYDIYFDEHVADDNLRISKLDANLLALEAIALYPDNSMFKATIRRNPKDNSKFQVINESKISKNQLKNGYLSEYDKESNLTNKVGSQNSKIDLSAYNVRTYHEYNVNRDTLVKNAEAAFSEISQTGIEGDLVVFGDYGLTAGCKVKLTDNLNPERNGTYVVSEVVTTFGTHGYRQKLKIPYKLSDK